MTVLNEVLENVNDANENLNKIEDRLFKVLDIDVPKPNDWGIGSTEEVVFEEPKAKVIYTSDGRHLGTTGDQYESLQPQDFFNAVVDNVRNSGMEFDLAKLEYNVLRDGKIIEFRLPTNIVSFKNKAGKQDDTEMFLNFWTGFGGTARTEIGLYSHRFICENGMKIINADVDLKVKHTKNMNVKALTFSKEIINVASKVQSTSQQWEEMNSVQVNTATVEQYVKQLAKFKKGEQYADVNKHKQRKYDSIQDAIATEFGSTGSTVWGLLNGATRYTNHKARGSENKDYILVRTGAKDNALAQKLAEELI